MNLSVRQAFGRPGRTRRLVPAHLAKWVRQGDPCGPLLFALALQGPLKRVRDASPDVRVVAYANDKHLQGRPEAAIEAFRLLVTATASIGLALSLPECVVYARTAAFGLAVASALGIAPRPDGLVAAGTPLSSDAFVKASARSQVETVASLVAALASRPLGRQDKFLLLRSSLQARLTHPTCITPRSRLSHHIAAAEWQVLFAAFDLVEHPPPAAMRSDRWSPSSPFPCVPAGLAYSSPPPLRLTPPSWQRPARLTRLCGPRRPCFSPSTLQTPTMLRSSLGGRRFTTRRLASGPRSFGRSMRPSLPQSSYTPSGSTAATSQTGGSRTCWPPLRPLSKAPDSGLASTPVHADQLPSGWTPYLPPSPLPCPTRTWPRPLASAWACQPGLRTPLAFPSASPALAPSSGGCASGLPVLVPVAPALAPAAEQPGPLSWPWKPRPLPDPQGVPPPLRSGAWGHVMFVFPRRLGWLAFPSSTRWLLSMLRALRTPPGLRLLPGTPPSSVRIGRCPPPCRSC
jgi:hypothetical protein